MSAARRLWPQLLLALLVVAVYFPVAGHGLVSMDDDLTLGANPQVLAGPTAAGLRWAFTTTLLGSWMPLTWLSHQAAAGLFGPAPAGHHLVNAGLHLANALLLFSFLRAATGARGPSLFAAAVFAVHPLHVESAAWVTGRKDVLMLFFALAALHAWLRHARRPSAGRLAAAAALFLCALASKALAVTLPLLMLLLDFWPLGRLRAPAGGGGPVPAARIGALLLEKAPFLALAVAAGVGAVLGQRAEGATRLDALLPFGQKAAHAAVAWCWYLGKAFWPSRLAVFYPYPAGPHPPAVVAGAVAGLLAATVAALSLARRLPALATGWCWFLIALLPAIGLVQVGDQAWADRYAYPAVAGLAVAGAWCARRIAGSARATRAQLTAAACLLVAALALACAAQVRHWRDDGTLFARALAVTRGNWVAENNYGTWLLDAGRLAEAEGHFAATIRIAPDAAQGYANLAKLRLAQGRAAEAAALYRMALERDPGSAR